jgi:hypothetical protein
MCDQQWSIFRQFLYPQPLHPPFSTLTPIKAVMLIAGHIKSKEVMEQVPLSHVPGLRNQSNMEDLG